MATNNSCNYSPVQFNVQIGAANGTLGNVAPGATSGVPVISQGAASNPVFGTASVAGGGTGATTLTGVLTGNGTSAVTANAVTNHGVLLGGASNAVSSLGVAATGTVLAGASGADPAFTDTPSVTSITVGGGSALSTFTDWTSFTPTLVGATTAGTTTYTSQNGQYMRIGNLVVIQFDVSFSAATGTGNVLIGNLPFTVNSTVHALGACYVNNLTFPLLATSAVIDCVISSTTAKVLCFGSGNVGAFLNIANATAEVAGTLIYKT